ncbi:MAG: nucleotidyltransferase domain-containing protein [Methanosarcinales archaeon]
MPAKNYDKPARLGEDKMNGKRTIRQIEYLLPRIRRILENIYCDSLVEVILYGSFARNAPTKDSDIDIAVVLKGKVNKAKEIDRIYDALYDLMLETGELISVYPVSEEEVGNLVWPLYYYIRTKGIKI